MSETDFQALFDEYTSGVEARKELAVIHLHEHIYRYASVRYKMTSDVSSDFYLYFQSSIESLFTDYNPDRGLSFLVFVAVRLRYSFSKFLRRRKISRGVHSVVDDYADWEMEISLNRAENPYDSFKKEYSSLHTAMKALGFEKEIILRIYFGFPLKYSHLRYCIKERGSFTFIEDYRVLLRKHKDDYMSKNIDFQKKLEKLSKLHQEKLGGKLINNYTKKRENLLENLLPKGKAVTQRDLAKILGKSAAYVNRRLQEALDELRGSLMIVYP